MNYIIPSDLQGRFLYINDFLQPQVLQYLKLTIEKEETFS